jgi:hypothetical protein
VSRLSSKSWLLLLRPDGATLRRQRPGLLERSFEEHEVRIEPATADFDEVCERVLPQLRAALGPPAATSGGLRVLVGDMWTRVCVIEGQFHRLNDRQIDLMVEVSLQELLDQSPARSDYRWQIQRGGRHLFASALLPGVAERATQIGADLGLAPASVSTHFAGAWNDADNPLTGRDSGVFAVVAGHYASVAWVHDGVLTGVTQGGLPAGELALERRVTRDLAAWAVDGDARMKFVLYGADAPVAARWQRHDLCKRTAP